jgi:hypothetical protein
MRVDFILDMTGKPGKRFQVTESFYRGLEHRLAGSKRQVDTTWGRVHPNLSCFGVELIMLTRSQNLTNMASVAPTPVVVYDQSTSPSR